MDSTVKTGLSPGKLFKAARMKTEASEVGTSWIEGQALNLTEGDGRTSRSEEVNGVTEDRNGRKPRSKNLQRILAGRDAKKVVDLLNLKLVYAKDNE